MFFQEVNFFDFVDFRMWTSYGLQSVSLPGYVVGMDPDSSDVTLQPIPTDGTGLPPGLNFYNNSSNKLDRS
jgi:hypothetical protein